MSFIAKETQGFYRMKLIKSLIFSSKNQLFYSSSYCTYSCNQHTGRHEILPWVIEWNIQYTILICQSRTSPEVIYLYVISFRHNYLLRHYWTDKTVACEKQNFQEILAIKYIHFYHNIQMYEIFYYYSTHQAILLYCKEKCFLGN